MGANIPFRNGFSSNSEQNPTIIPPNTNQREGYHTMPTISSNCPKATQPSPPPEETTDRKTFLVSQLDGKVFGAAINHTSQNDRTTSRGGKGLKPEVLDTTGWTSDYAPHPRKEKAFDIHEKVNQEFGKALHKRFTDGANKITKHQAKIKNDIEKLEKFKVELRALPEKEFTNGLKSEKNKTNAQKKEEIIKRQDKKITAKRQEVNKLYQDIKNLENATYQMFRT